MPISGKASPVRAGAGDATAAASALRNLGRMAIDQARFDTAHRLLDESLALDEANDNPFGRAWSLNYLGLLAHFQGDNGTATARIKRSLPMLRALDDRWGMAVALAYLGSAVCDQGDTSAAASLWIESLDTCRAQRYLWCIPCLLEFFGGLAITQGHLARGLRLAGAADALHDSIGAPLPPVWRAALDRRLAAARRSLDEAAYAAARTRLQAVEGRAGLEVTFDCQGDERLPPDREAELFRLAQEALNNVLKHAHARHVQVDFDLAANPVVLEVADDGVGFDPSANGAGGFSLPGMRERAERLGGTLSVTSAPGAGSRVRVEVPR
jgi:hypothetical protein